MYTILKSVPELRMCGSLILSLLVLTILVMTEEKATNTFNKRFFLGMMIIMILVLCLIASAFIKIEKNRYTFYTIHVDDKELSEILSKYKVEKDLGNDIFIITDNPGEQR